MWLAKDIFLMKASHEALFLLGRGNNEIPESKAQSEHKVDTAKTKSQVDQNINLGKKVTLGQRCWFEYLVWIPESLY